MLSRRPRWVGRLPRPASARGSGKADRDAERRRRRAVLARGRSTRPARSGSGSPPTPSSPRSSRPSTAPTTSSGSTSRSTRSPSTTATTSTSSSPAAASCSTAFARGAATAGVGERVHFLGAVPHAELPNVLRAADLFVLDDRATGVVRDRPDRGDGLRAAGDRDRLPRGRAVVDDGETGCSSSAATPARSPSASPSSPTAPTRRAEHGDAGPAKALREWSWPTARRPHGRRLRRGDRGAPAKDAVMGRRILYVAYFYPPSRDTGMLRSAAMAKWLRRLGHEVTVLTTSAYGERRRRGRRCRTGDVQSWRARRQGRESIGAMFDSPTYSGQAAPAEQGDRAGGAGRRLAAVRALARARARPPAELRLRDHELAAGVGARDRHGAAPPRRSVGRRRSRRLDLRAAAPALPDRGVQRRLDEWLERRWLGAADAVVCVAEPAAEDLRRRGIAEPTADHQRLGSREPRPQPGPPTGPARPRARLARLHRPLRLLRARPARPRRGLGRARPRAARRRRRGSSS